jgi:hypothetical protein
MDNGTPSTDYLILHSKNTQFFFLEFEGTALAIALTRTKVTFTAFSLNHTPWKLHSKQTQKNSSSTANEASSNYN